ncbi:MAG: hypothetical protein U0528_13285 [Anaerolineae bacterium]
MRRAVLLATLCFALFLGTLPPTVAQAQATCTLRLNEASYFAAAPSRMAAQIKPGLTGRWSVNQIVEDIDGALWGRVVNNDNVWLLLNDFGKNPDASCKKVQLIRKDTVTPEDKVPAPAALNLNDALDVTFTPNARRFAFKFSGKAGDLVSIEMDRPMRSVGRYGISLFSPAGRRLTTGVHDVDKPIKLEGTLPDTGDYVLLFGHFSGISAQEKVNVTGSLRLVASAPDVVSDTDLGNFPNAATLSGKLIKSLDAFLYIKDGWAFIYTRHLAMVERPADNMLLIGNKPALLNALVNSGGFKLPNNATTGDFISFFVRLTPEEVIQQQLGATMPDIATALFRKYVPEGRNLKPAFKQMVLAETYWHQALINDNYDAMIKELEDGSVVFSVRAKTKGGIKTINQFDIIDTIDSMSSSGFPLLTNKQRAAIGLPPQRADSDAPTLKLDVALPLTFSSPQGGYSFNYPAGNWTVTNNEASNDSILGGLASITGSTSNLIFQEGSKRVVISVLRPVPLAIFPPSFWMDLTFMSGEGLGINTEYKVEQAFVGDTLLTIIETTDALNQQIFRVDIRPVMGGMYTLITNGADVGTVVPRDVLLAIAGSFRSL